MIRTRELHLLRKPDGMPRSDDFGLVEVEVSEPQDGDVMVENLYLSIDPATRPWLSRGQQLNMAVMGFAIGRVVRSRDPQIAEGDIVRSAFGYREHFVCEGRFVGKVIPDPALPLSVYIHMLGGVGFAAYGGLIAIGKMAAGETVFVSAAGGAVGSAAVQIAKLKGCRTIGSTGNAEKAEWLRSLGVDSVINYNTDPIGPALRDAAAKGVDLYFDNVGGDHLEAALACMNSLGRVAVCGMISSYNGVSPGIHNLSTIIYNRVNIRGFVSSDFDDLHPDFVGEMTQWLKSGQVQYRETVKHGIAEAAAAFIGLLKGDNIGKMLVQLREL